MARILVFMLAASLVSCARYGGTGTDPCEGITCSGHGTCDSSSGTAVCNCDEGYQDNDSDGTCEPDCDTAGLSCGDHGNCSDLSGTAACVCDTGYAGTFCNRCAAGYHDEGGACVLDQTCEDGGTCPDGMVDGADEPDAADGADGGDPGESGDSQSEVETWARVYSARFDIDFQNIVIIIGGHNFIQQTQDGGWILAGELTSSDCSGVLKLLSNGETEWLIGWDVNDFNYGRAIQQTPDGGYLVVGGTYRFNSQDTYILKIASNGDMGWQRFISSWEFGDIVTIFETSGGDYVIAGNGSSHVWVFSMDASANILSGGIYGLPEYQFMNLASIRQTSDDGYILAGEAQPPADSTDMWMMKLAPNWEVEWQRTYDGGAIETIHDIRETLDGGFIVTGIISSFGAGGWDVLVMKADAGGEIVWQKTYGGADRDFGISVDLTGDGGYIVAGKTSSFGAGQSDMWLLKIDGEGVIEWQKTYGGSSHDTARSVFGAPDGGYFVIGNSESFGHGGSTLLFMKIDHDGNLSVPCQDTLTSESSAQVHSSFLVGSTPTCIMEVPDVVLSDIDFTVYNGTPLAMDACEIERGPNGIR